MAAQSKRQEKPLPLDPAVRTGKLPNGFTYYIRHNEEPKNRVVMYLVNKAGSVLEDEDQRGLAHFMEHMSFNGTKHFPKNELVDYLQKSGVRFGADLNAYTSFDETVYQLPLPSNKPELLKGGIEIMRDWAQEATLEPVEIDKERGVVLEEKRLGKGAGERMQRVYWPVILNNSRYAVRIPIGLDTVLDNFKRPTIARFYHDWYRPDLQALVIVGDINADSLVQVIKKKFSDLKNPSNERLRTKFTVPLNGQNHFIAVTDKEMTTTEAEVLIKHEQLPVKTASDYRDRIIRELFNLMLQQRYAELARQANPPFVQGSAGISGFTGGLNSYNASVIAKPGELETGFKAVWRETERVKRFGFTTTELERAKAEYLSRVEDQLSEKDKTNSEALVREYQANFLNGIAAPGIVKEYQLTKDDLPDINLAEVNNLAKINITNTNRDILILAPDKDKTTLPDETTVKNWLNAIEQENLQPYKDDASTQLLLAVQPQKGKIVAEQQDASLGTTTLTLSNGVKVFLKPTDYKENEIQFTAFAQGGTSLASDADYQSALSAAGIMWASGIGNYNSNQLDKFLSGKQLYVGPYINERFEGINGYSTKQDLETALQMVYAYFTEPRKDSLIFRGLIESSRAGLANRADNPAAVFSDTVNAVLGNYNIRKTGPSLEKLQQVNLDRVYDFYKNRFSDASGFTFVFVGNIDTNSIKPLVEKYLGGLPATRNSALAKDLGIHIPYGKIAKTVYKGAEPKASVILVYSGLFDFTQENRIRMDALKETLEIRLVQRLREDESGVYSPGVSVSDSKFPQGRYSFVVQFGCAPQNVEKLIASANDEIAKLKANGPLQENLDKWRVEDRSTRETQLKTNNYWLAYINTRLQNAENFDQVSLYDGIRDKVSVKDIQVAASAYLSGNNYIRLVLLPETVTANK